MAKKEEFILRVKFVPKFKVPVLAGSLFSKSDVLECDISKVFGQLKLQIRNSGKGICENCGAEDYLNYLTIRKTRKHLFLCSPCYERLKEVSHA